MSQSSLKQRLSQYLFSVPERLLRSATALSAGLVREASDIALPLLVRRTRLYQSLVESSLRFLIEQVGQVEGVYPEGDKLAENFLLRRTAGNGLEMAGILAFRASPVWVMAALADVSGAGKELIHEISVELKREGLLSPESQVHTIEQLLDGLERTAARVAEACNTPPLDIASLRQEWTGFQQDLAFFPQLNRPATQLPSANRLWESWRGLQDEARRQQRSVFELSSVLALSAASQVPDALVWLGKSAAVASRHTGVLVIDKLLNHYVTALAEVRKVGFVPYSVRQYRPYLHAAALQFSPKHLSLTQKMLKRGLPLLALLSLVPFASAQNKGEAEVLRAHVSFLASDLLEGRDTPSRGLALAAEYIAAQFRRIGLSSSADGSYFAEAPPQLAIQVGGSTQTIDLQNVRGDLPAIVRGRIVKVSSSEAITRDRVQNQIVFAPLAIAEEIRENREALGPRQIFAVANRSSEASDGMVVLWDSRLREAFDSWPEGRTEAVVASRPPGLKNVVGILQGSNPKLRKQCVVVSAHYDHVGMRTTGEDRIMNGANDDASGVAGVIATAEALSKARPLRTIVFVTFFGEEKGLMGSSFYGQSPACPIAETVAQLNLEQIGRTDDAKGPRVAAVTLTGNNYSDVGVWFAKAAVGTGGKVDPLNGDDFFPRSDNLALARLGVPAHTVSTAFEFPDYHQPGDEAAKLDYNNMSIVVRMITKAVAFLGNNPGTPRWRTVNPRAEPFAKAATPLAKPQGVSALKSGSLRATPKPKQPEPLQQR